MKKLNKFAIIKAVNDMYTIAKNEKNELIIKNSRFITLLIKITNKDEVDNYLKEIKKHYPRATHYCYAYKIGENIKKASDDGEPGGTAGMPMLNVLDKEDITNILAITVRYFGGIKLGAGGLIRAYSNSIKEALNKTTTVELIKGVKCELTFPYSKEKEILQQLPKENIINKIYLENITYVVLLEKNSPLLNKSSTKILEEIYIQNKTFTNN